MDMQHCFCPLFAISFIIFTTLLLPRLGSCATGYSIFADSWSLLSRSVSEPRCVNIPSNFTLCHGLEYTKMRLPNLLEHETLMEATEQASSWMPLIRLNCHSDTQLFLCSLFAPVCLEKHDIIRPCRSLCEAVKGKCANRMAHYGFPWPEMLRCDKFPATHDMCIQPRVNYVTETENGCPACTQIGTYENILDNFCRSSHVMKVKLKAVGKDHVEVRKGRSLKSLQLSKRSIRGMRLYFNENGTECPCKSLNGHTADKFLVMGSQNNSDRRLVLNLLLPWEKQKKFRRAVRMFRKLDCRSLGERIRNRARRERARKYRKSGRRRYKPKNGQVRLY